LLFLLSLSLSSLSSSLECDAFALETFSSVFLSICSLNVFNSLALALSPVASAVESSSSLLSFLTFFRLFFAALFRSLSSAAGADEPLATLEPFSTTGLCLGDFKRFRGLLSAFSMSNNSQKNKKQKENKFFFPILKFEKKKKKEEKKKEKEHSSIRMLRRSEVLQLYRSLLRASDNWPVVENRVDRGLKMHVRERVRDEFRRGSMSQDRLAYGRAELEALEALSHDVLTVNYAGKGLPSTAPDMVGKADRLLSTDAQNKIAGRRWGFIERITGFFIK
jgi:Complex 1 protein (LYR family)